MLKMKVIDTQNYNVSIVEPIDNFVKGISIPSKGWDVTTKGDYSFAGTPNYQDFSASIG